MMIMMIIIMMMIIIIFITIMIMDILEAVAVVRGGLIKLSIIVNISQEAKHTQSSV